MALPAPPSAPRPGPHRSPTVDRRNVVTSRILAMREIFQAVPNKIETEPPPDGEVFAPGVAGGTGGPGGPGTVLSWLDLSNLAPPPTSKPSTSPPRISRMMKGSLIFRVQPSYPALARATRGQGPVVLGAVLSRTETIASLHGVSGHPLLVKSAIEAVEQWRYRPYRLNGDPVELETEVTLNFVLAGG